MKFTFLDHYRVVPVVRCGEWYRSRPLWWRRYISVVWALDTVWCDLRRQPGPSERVRLVATRMREESERE